MPCDDPAMIQPAAIRTRRPLLAALYTDAMVLADDTRACIEQPDQDDDDALDPVTRVLLSCEQLRMTTRLMTVLAWLLAWRAVDAGEMDGAVPPRLDAVPLPDAAAIGRFSDRTRMLIDGGVALHRRATFLDAAIVAAATTTVPMVSPALAIQRRLAAAL